MEFRLRPLGFMEFLQKQQSKFHELNIYIYQIYIYRLLFLLCNSSILDFGHSPYYISLGSTQTHKVI